MFDHWYDNAGNVFILGRSQTGKTALAREIHDNQRVSIWVNERGDDRVPDVPRDQDYAYKSIQGLEKALSRNERNIEFLTDDRAEAVEKLKAWLWTKAELGDRRVPFQIVCDELHRVAPQSAKDYGNLPGRDQIRDFTKEGMKRNIKLVGITQDPVSMDKQSLRQREYLVLLGLAKEQRDYVGEYVDDLSPVFNQPEYAGVVYHAEGNVVAEGAKAQRRYVA